MKCFKCDSVRIMEVSAKTSDRFASCFEGNDHDGYVPYDVGIGGGDYVEFDYCLDCGQIQGNFPVFDPEFE